jgi:hypothetical protein
MIIHSALAHQWERERNLDHIKIRTSAQARQNPLIVSERVERCHILVSTKVDHLILQPIVVFFVCHA